MSSIYKKRKWSWIGRIPREGIEKWTGIVTGWYPRINKRWNMKYIDGAKWTRISKGRTKFFF